VGGTCGKDGKKTATYRLLIRKREGKKSLGLPRRRWIDNIKMSFKEMYYWVVWTRLAWLRIRTSGELL
jgi:hypothetical protein